MNKIELLCPAGSLSKLKASVSGGADAVYLGLGKFNARQSAGNFDAKELEEAIKICKSNNVKIYLTMNTLVKNSELKEFLELIKEAYEQGIDAVIIQDPSLISIIKKNFPELKIHLSTQTGIMNSSHANLFSGINRINLARELNKKNIELFRKNFKKETEIFIHGALCACISGSCLFSSLLGQRSGNRGRCAQPCRKLYNDAFLLSTKELCLIDKLPEIINLGINSLKIEGRMRNPFYAYTTASVYRKAIDSFYKGKFQVTFEMKKELENAYSREFTEGKYSDKYVFNIKKASGNFEAKEVSYNPPVKNIKIEKRVAKLESVIIKTKPSPKKQLIIRVYNEEDAITAEKYADIICLDMFHKDFQTIGHRLNKPLYAVTPRIMFDSDLESIKKKIKDLSPAGIVAGNPGILSFDLDIPLILDSNSNCFNDLQLNYYQTLKARPIISPELSLQELQDFKNKDFIVFVHGKIRLMTLAHELIENTIMDQKGFDFQIKKIFNGAEILNGKELGLFNKLRPLVKSGVNQFYIDTESNLSASIEDVLKIYRQILDGKTPDASKIQKHYNLGWSKLGVW